MNEFAVSYLQNHTFRTQTQEGVSFNGTYMDIVLNVSENESTMEKTLFWYFWKPVNKIDYLKHQIK